jgi:hypothetical protein
VPLVTKTFNVKDAHLYTAIRLQRFTIGCSNLEAHCSASNGIGNGFIPRKSILLD